MQQFKKNKQQSAQHQANATRHRVGGSGKLTVNSAQQRPNYDHRSMLDVQQYSNFSPNVNENYHQLQQQNHLVRSDSPSQFDDLDIDEHQGVGVLHGPEEDFGELNEFEEQMLEPTEYQDLTSSMHPQTVGVNSDSYHTLQNKQNKKMSFAQTQSFAQANSQQVQLSNLSSPQSSTAMIQSQQKVQKGQNVANENNLIVRHNRFQNLINNNKYRINNRQIKQVQTQKNSQVRQKMNEEFFQHGSPATSQNKGTVVRNQQSGDPNKQSKDMNTQKASLNKKQIQMIQNLPPSVVLNSNKTKLQGGKTAGLHQGKALSTHVSPSASSTSFIVGSHQNQNICNIKMTYAGQINRDSKGSGHNKYPKNSGQPVYGGNQQYMVQNVANNYNSVPSSQHHNAQIAKQNSIQATNAAGKLKIRKYAGDGQQHQMPASQSNSLNRQKLLPKDHVPQGPTHINQPFSDIKKERTFDAQINNTLSQKYKQAQPQKNSSQTGQQKLKIKMQGSFQHNFSSQSSSSKAIAGAANGSTTHLAQSSGQLILFPNKRPVAGTTVVSADASPRGTSSAAHAEQKQLHGQMQKYQKHSKAAANTGTKSAGKQAASTSGPATALSTPANFSPSTDNTIGLHKQRKVVVVGSRGTFQQQIHHSHKSNVQGPSSQGGHAGSKQTYKQNNQQQLRKILRNNLVSVQLGDTDQGSTGRETINKRNENSSLVLKNSYCPETQSKYFDAQNSLGNALVSRTQQVHPGGQDYHGQQLVSVNFARAQQTTATNKSGTNSMYSNANSQSQALHQQAVKQVMHNQQQQKILFSKQQNAASGGVTNTFVPMNRSNGSKKVKVQQQRADKPMVNKPQAAKATQAKSFMLREKDVHFQQQYQQPPGRLSVSKQPALVKSGDSSFDNIQFNDEEDMELEPGDHDIHHNPESPQRHEPGPGISYHQGVKSKMKVQTDSYNSKILRSMLKGGDQEFGEDRSPDQHVAQSRAAATGLVTLKGFGSATGYRTAQVSAHVSALASKNHSNNSSQVRQQQFSGPTANQVGNKIFYHGPASISGSASANHHTVNTVSIGTQLQKHGQLGTTLRQQKKQQMAHGSNTEQMSASHQASRLVKKGLVADKKNVVGSVSHDAGDPGNFSGIAGSTTNQTTIRKHGVVSQSNSKLASFHSNQVTGQGSRENSFKHKRQERIDHHTSTGPRPRLDAGSRQTHGDEDFAHQSSLRPGDHQFKVQAMQINQPKMPQRTGSTHQNRSEEPAVGRGQVHKTPSHQQQQHASIKKKALQPSHPSQSQGHKGVNGSQRADRGMQGDTTPAGQGTNQRQLSGGNRSIMTPYSSNPNSASGHIAQSQQQSQYQTPTTTGKHTLNDPRHSPLRNVMEFRDKNNKSGTQRGSNREDDNTSMNSQKQQMEQYYNDIKKLKEHIKTNFGQVGYMIKSTSDFYRIGRVLGRGAFGKVNLACHKVSEHLVAIKSIEYAVLRNEKEHKRRLMQEMSILKQSANQNVVKLYDSFETSKHMCFVMELCQGGDLLSYVRKRRKLKEDNAKYLFKQMVSGLHYIHSRKFVVHRDIKLDNILIDQSGQIKICDFGVSRQLKSEKEKMYEQCGTPAYVAPEVIGQKGYRGFKADMWSAGVCLYVMLLGTVPFRSNTMEELHKLILKGRFDFQGEKVSNEAKDLICGLIQVNYRKRLTAKQALDHPWLQTTSEGNEPIDINRPDLADVIFTENEKQNIKNHYLCRLEKLKKKRYNQRKKIIQQAQESQAPPKHSMYQSQSNATGKKLGGNQQQLEYKMQQQMQRTFTEGDFIFTEHNLDTKEDEMQERRPTREKGQQKEKINSLFQKNTQELNADGSEGVFNKFEAFDVKPKARQGSQNGDKNSVQAQIPQVPVKNCSEKSIIYAPFNSSFTDFDEDQPQLFKWPDEVLELMQPKRSKIIKFSKRCRDLNREYEENNNADLDNGVYNAFVNEQEMEAERQQQEEMMLAAKNEEKNKLNNSMCSPDDQSKNDDASSPNVVLNLDSLKNDPKANRADLLKIEEKGFGVMNSFNSSSDSEEDNISEDDKYARDPMKGGPAQCPGGVNVSPSSVIEGKNKDNQDDGRSLNSSRMTGTQELSIHEGMQVMHEMENQQQQKKNDKIIKKKKSKANEEVVFNLEALHEESQKTQEGLEASGQLEEIDDNIVQYTVEQFLDSTTGAASELKNHQKGNNGAAQHKNSNVASGRSSHKHGLFQQNTVSKGSVLSGHSKAKISQTVQEQPSSDYHEYHQQRLGSGGGQRPNASNVMKSQQQINQQRSSKELPTQALAHNMKLQLYQCLRTHNLNYLTAAYYLTQKHEFS